MIDTSQMDTFAVDCGAAPVTARVSRFQGENGATEWHMVICPTEYGTIGDQLTWIQRAYQSTLTTLGIDEQSAVFRRFFCSDLANQAPALEARPFSSRRDTDTPCAISWICQTPTGPAKVALWAYHLKDAGAALDKTKDGSTMALRRGPLTHYWTTGETFIDAGASYAQTRGVLENYDAFLTAKGMTMAHNVMRTWFFVQNIDADYTGLVTVRREFFESRGLTRKTHFISSTGIEGAYANTAAKITLDAYAIAGVQQGAPAISQCARPSLPGRPVRRNLRARNCSRVSRPQACDCVWNCEHRLPRRHRIPGFDCSAARSHVG